MEHPLQSHLMIVKRILRFVKGTLHLGLLFPYSKSHIKGKLIALHIVIGVGTLMIGRVPLDMSFYLKILHSLGVIKSRTSVPYQPMKMSM